MSKNKSEREFIFKLWQKENIHVLNNVLGTSLADIRLELKKYRLEIDMLGMDTLTGREVYIENTLTPSNSSHQERLIKLIQRMEGGIIVYQAVKFRDKHVQELKEAVMATNKSIKLILVQINDDLLPILDELNYRTHKLKVYSQLCLLNSVKNPITVVTVVDNHNDWLNSKLTNSPLSIREQNNLFLLQKLREAVPYFYSFQRHKSNLDKTRIISFGMGANDVSLFLSLENFRYQAFVELRTGRNTKLYDSLKQEENKARELLGDTLAFKDKENSISYYFKPYPNIEKTVNRITEVAGCFIKVFSDRILYPNGEFSFEEPIVEPTVREVEEVPGVGNH